jgi:hypothetical protein
MGSATDADRVAETTAAWRAAGERGDADAAAHCLADHAELISPLTRSPGFAAVARFTRCCAAFEV